MSKKVLGLVIVVLLASALVVSAQPSSRAAEVLKVGATPVPHAEILEFVKPLLAKEGIKLEIVEFTDYVQPNLALDSGDLDANYFQHIPYLKQFSADHNLNLTYTAKVHIEPMAIFSNKIKDLSELGKGAQVAIPNDPTNGGRALLLLQSAGLIKLAEDVGLTATPFDIVENPKDLRIVELEAAQLPRSLEDVDAAVINGNYALEAGLSVLDDALFIENADSPYVNVLAVRAGDDNPALKKLAEVLTSPEVKEFILNEYNGSVVPAF
ncbi:MAG: MetQ/NlpA family ABC transporter substrate-binding protein [Firmicutes bacterium]|nr:MetQ/NlpA family ABC transporter substrate-binding protein [Bacillota bacterium]